MELGLFVILTMVVIMGIVMYNYYCCDMSSHRYHQLLHLRKEEPRLREIIDNRAKKGYLSEYDYNTICRKYHELYHLNLRQSFYD